MQGEKLRGDKGINLPESALRLAAMTAKDLEDLPFVAQHADVVELSFLNKPRDVELLQQHLALLGARQPAIVLKIETRRGFENLADLLVTAMRAPCCGVMIARGDLVVECGFERFAEVQEEILWICEAAHIPVIWAAQVLETFAKEGFPSRAEITDAAMGEQAECVMLNKGPHILEALRALDDILQREQDRSRGWEESAPFSFSPGGWYGPPTLLAIAKRDRNPPIRVWEKRQVLKEGKLSTNAILQTERMTHMTVAQIEDEIRLLGSSERVELYRWLDHAVVEDCGAGTSLCSRLGAERSLEIGQELAQDIKMTPEPRSN